jgi:hypothetical protein
MGLWRNVAFVRAPQAATCAALIAILARRGRREATWGAPADLQYARAAATPWWALAGFDGAAGWTCLLMAPFDVLTADGGALLGELSRSLGGPECWQLDVEDGDSMRVIRASGGGVARAGYVTSELDAGMDFDPGMTLPVLGDVAIAEACAAARASDPAARVQVVVDGQLRPRHPADVVEELARADVAHVDAAAQAIARVFGGAHAELVDNLTTIECLIRRSRPLPAAASFTLFTSGATA